MIDEILLSVYLLYKRSPKKLSELKEIHENLKEEMGFTEGGVKPQKANGTRWVAHMVSAIKMLIDKWGIYIHHLEQMKEDKSYKGPERAKFSGYLTKWKQPRIPLLALFADRLDIPRRLSLELQKDQITLISAMQKLSDTNSRMTLFENKQFEKSPQVKHFLSNLGQTEDDSYVYQGIQFSSGLYEQTFKQVKEQKNRLLRYMRKGITNRLEDNDENEILLASDLDTEYRDMGHR